MRALHTKNTSARAREEPIIEPTEEYECVGQVPNVIFSARAKRFDYTTEGKINDLIDFYEKIIDPHVYQ